MHVTAAKASFADDCKESNDLTNVERERRAEVALQVAEVERRAKIDALNRKYAAMSMVEYLGHQWKLKPRNKTKLRHLIFIISTEIKLKRFRFQSMLRKKW